MSCNAWVRTDGWVECSGPLQHEGYEHAKDVDDIEVALEAARHGGPAVYDCDGDTVHRIEPPDEHGALLYSFGSSGAVAHNHISFILIPESETASPEEVRAAIESIRNATI